VNPTAGRIVLYTLSEDDARCVNQRRTTSQAIARESAVGAWPNGAQAHVGNEAFAGDVVPMLIVRVWSGGLVNGQAFLDGNDVLWVMSRGEGATPGVPGTWAWPPRSPS